jgi:cytochrome oxidase Cu insertion factor (SCO1/SenC/PrrC family)
MKIARFLLACAAASVLAACGSQTITSPAAAPARPHADGITSGCIKVTVTNPDGTTSEKCVSDSNGQLGSGL